MIISETITDFLYKKYNIIIITILVYSYLSIYLSITVGSSINLSIYLSITGDCPVCWGFRIHGLVGIRKPSHPASDLDMTLNNLMERDSSNAGAFRNAEDSFNAIAPGSALTES